MQVHNILLIVAIATVIILTLRLLIKRMKSPICPDCQSEDMRFVREDNSYLIYNCRSCGANLSVLVGEKFG